MSAPFDPSILTRRTTANMDGKEWYLVSPSGDDDLALTGDNLLSIGALTNDVADGSSDPVFLGVQIGGMIKVKCGAGISAGQLCGATGGGKAGPLVGAHAGGVDAHSFGIALGDYDDGEVGAFLWSPSYLTIA